MKGMYRIALALALLVGLAACSGSNDGLSKSQEQALEAERDAALQAEMAAQAAQAAAERAAREAQDALEEAQARVTELENQPTIAELEMAVSDAQAALAEANDARTAAMEALTAAENAVTAALAAVASATDASIDDALAALQMRRDEEATAATAVASANSVVIARTATLGAAQAALAAADPSRAALEEARQQLTAAEEARKAAEEELAARQKAREDQEAAERAKENAKTARALWMGIGEGALVTGDVTFSGGKLMAAGVDVDPTVDPAAAPFTLDPTNDAVPSLGAWNGRMYSKTTNGVGTDTATIYTNKGPDKTESFLDAYSEDTNFTVATNSLAAAGIMADKVASASFTTTSGAQTFTIPESGRRDISGTYDGASGTFRCTGTEGQTCTATVSGDGYALAGTGTWTFLPATNAMVRRPDTVYLAFGWWLRKTEDGMYRVAPVTTAMGTVPPAGDINALQGSATYQGAAAGKYATFSSLGGTPDAGHFTASATLNAKWGNNTASGTVTGSLANFRGSDGESRDWTVDLNEAAVGDGVDTFGGAACTTCTTQWSIDGVSEDKAGNWGGTFYDPVGTGKAGEGTPMSATGTFTAEYGAVGEMIGAFGVTRQ